jgi:hypothetical protein
MRTRSVCRLRRLRSIQRRFRGVCLRPALQRVGDKPAKWMRKRCGVRKDQSIRLYRQFYDGDFTEASGFSPLLRVLQVSLWPTPGEGVAIRVAVRPTLVEGVAIRVAPRRTGITTGRTGGDARGTVRRTPILHGIAARALLLIAFSCAVPESCQSADAVERTSLAPVTFPIVAMWVFT